MKRTLSILLILVLAFTLVACNSNKPAEETKETTEATTEETTTEATEMMPEDGATLIVWESEGPEGEFMQYVAEKFEEKYGVSVSYEPVTHTDSRNRLSTDGPAGTGGDVFAAPHDHVGALVASGLVYPNSIGKERVLNEYMTASSSAVTFENEVYGYPTAIETYGLYYNADLYNEAPKTYAEIVEFAKGYNDPSNNKFALFWNVNNAYFSHSFVAGAGGYVFGNNGSDRDDIGLATPEAIKGLEEMVALKEILPLQDGDASYDAMTGLFHEGKVAAMINGPWAVSGAEESGINYAIAPLPTLADGSHPTSFSGTRSLFVSSYSNYPQAAQLFAQFATSDEMLLKRFEMTKQIPPVKALLDAEAIAGDAKVAPFLAQAQYAVPMPSIPEMGYVWEPYAAAFGSAWNGDVTPEEALTTAVETIKSAIATQEQ